MVAFVRKNYGLIIVRNEFDNDVLNVLKLPITLKYCNDDITINNWLQFKIIQILSAQSKMF